MNWFKREPQQQEEVQEPPEHSVALRLVVFLMASLCVGSSCYFSRVEPLIWVLFMVTVLTGSYLSYIYRNDENKWLRRIAFIGIVAVGYLAGKRFLSPLSTEYDFVSPFVIFLAGVFSSLCFEMRSRSDLNLSSGLGLLLLCITAPVARGLLFGGVVLSYILLGGLMLYFDCLSRTLNAWLEKTIEDAPKLDFSRSGGGKRRNRFGSTLGLLAFFPLLAAMMFLFMPRIDSFLDMTMAYAKTLNPDYVLDMAMGSQGPASRPPQDKGQSARDWFQKNSQVLSNLKKNEKKDEKTKEKLTSTQPDKDKAGIPEPKKDKDKDKDKKQQAKQVKQEKQDKSKAKTEKHKKEKSKSDKDKEDLNPEPQDKKKVDNPKGASKKNTPDSKQKHKGKAAAKSDKKPESKEKSDSKAGASRKKDKSDKSGSSDKSGKGAGGSGGGGAEGGGDDGTIILGDDEKFDARRPYVTNDGLVLVVKARRLSYLRRQAYDNFDGKFWTKSDESPSQPQPQSKSKSKSKSQPVSKPEAKTVKVVDGEIKRDSLKEAMEKAAIARQAAPRAVVQQPASTASILMKSGPISKQEGIVMSQAGSGQNANAPVQTQPEPIPVDTAANTSDQYRDLVTRLSKGRTYEYLSRERPLFRVGLADALSLPPRYPSVSMTQEVVVKAKSIGRILPGAWIPKEVVIDQKEMSVDRYGVMKMSDEIKKDAKFKIQTELPIFNLAYMRQRPPLGANEEEVIRDNFAQYLQLPKSISENTFDIAESNTSPEFNWFVQSEQLAQYLRENYAYNYETDYVECDDMVNSFLEDQTGGQCTHFASTFVILNRCVGIPSRMVTGFAPGGLDQMTGERKVTGKDLHAWAESYIPEFGWVPFDATPDGFLPAQQRESTYTADDIKEDLGLNEEEKKKTLEQTLNIAAWILGLLALLAMLVILGRKFLPRLLAWWRARRTRGQEWKQYKKVLKAVKTSTSVDREPQETPTEYTFRVRQTVDRLSREGQPTPSGLPDSLDQFMQLYTDIYFGQRKGKMEDLKYYADLVSTHSRNRK